METKDQRLEMRVKQQTLNSMDEIIASVDMPYKITRSDLGRVYIEQGIERHYGRGPKDEGDLSLAERLNIYFQICQNQYSRGIKPRALSRPQDNQRYMVNNYKESTVTADALVSRVYLQRFTWFYELDKTHLESINTELNDEAVLSLINQQHNPVICKVLESVIAMREMFAQIESVKKAAEQKLEQYNDGSVRSSLARIDGYAVDNGIPLSFEGYPDTAEYTQQIQMWSLLNWINNGEGHFRISDFGLRHDKDLTDKYTIMLEVYKNIRLNNRFDLDALEQLVKNRQFYQL